MTVVVGYDGHERSDAALDRAIDEARDTHARLVVLAVLEMPLDPDAPRNYGTLDDSPVRTMPSGEPPGLEPLFERARARIETAGVKADYEWAVGDPVDSIVETAHDRHAKLVVLGAHEQSWLGRLVGSEDVAAEVRERVDCEVVAV